jgi:hypothetical protein
MIPNTLLIIVDIIVDSQYRLQIELSKIIHQLLMAIYMFYFTTLLQ